MSSTVLKSTTIDDRDGNITYVPDQWTVHTNVESIFHLYANTDTFSDIQNATATVKFYGTAIEYWGNQGPYHGPCIISVDGHEMTTVNSHADADGYPILLYTQSNLTLGDHKLEVKVVNPSYPNVCEVDRFVVNVTSTEGNGGGGRGGSPGTGASNNTNTGSKKGPPVAILAGAIGGAVALLLIMIICFCFCRRIKQTRTTSNKLAKPVFDDDHSSHTPPNITGEVQYRALSAASPDPPRSPFGTPSTNMSAIPPFGATTDTYNPYVTHNGMSSVHPAAPSPSSHGSIPASTSVHFTTPRPSSSARNDYDQPREKQQPGAHVWNPDQLVPSLSGLGDQNRYSAVSYGSPPVVPQASDNNQSAAHSEKEREAYSSFNASASGSGSGLGTGGQHGRPIILSPDVEPELPPPAYEG